jgi:hypothetical protein
MTNPTLFHVTLLVASIHLVQCGKCDHSGVIVHRRETIRLINEELRNKDRPASDTPIAALANLAIIVVSIVNVFTPISVSVLLIFFSIRR